MALLGIKRVILLFWIGLLRVFERPLNYDKGRMLWKFMNKCEKQADGSVHGVLPCYRVTESANEK
jgi:hypothetical protein